MGAAIMIRLCEGGDTVCMENSERGENYAATCTTAECLYACSHGQEVFIRLIKL
jgi:hypothetical protein